MTACNSYETHNIYPNLNDQKQFRLNKINQIKKIGMMNSQRNDTEKVNLIEESKKKQVSMRLLNTMKLLIKV